jgi:hypothetical protein
MKSIQTLAVINMDHTMTVRVLPEWPLGTHHVIVVLGPPEPNPPPDPLPPNTTYSRQDLYGDFGR